MLRWVVRGLGGVFPGHHNNGLFQVLNLAATVSSRPRSSLWALEHILIISFLRISIARSCTVLFHRSEMSPHLRGDIILQSLVSGDPGGGVALEGIRVLSSIILWRWPGGLIM